MRFTDRLLSFNGVTPPKGGQATQRFSETLREKLKDGSPATLVVRRAGGEQTVTVTPAHVCDYPLRVIEGDDINAFADGQTINVFTGLMRFADSDEELATVVGHELAHNTMKHINAKRINAGIGLVVDILFAAAGINTQGVFSNMGAAAYSKEFEAEADYVGLYALALANRDIDIAPNFWRRMATVNPTAIKGAYNATHPSTPERFLHLEQTVAEIKTKRAQGLALMPDMKKQPPTSETAPAQGVGFAPK